MLYCRVAVSFSIMCSSSPDCWDILAISLADRLHDLLVDPDRILQNLILVRSDSPNGPDGIQGLTNDRHHLLNTVKGLAERGILAFQAVCALTDHGRHLIHTVL